MSYTVTKKVDAVGSFCPGPLMELVRGIKEVEVGEIVELLSSDKGSAAEVQKWCEKSGNELLEIKQYDGDTQGFVIKKGERKRRRRRE